MARALNKLASVAQELVAGVDEAGRGPLAGPVIAAAVVLDPQKPVDGLADSKKLSASQRKRLEAEIFKTALSVSVGRAEVEEIDRLNILWATMLAMERAVAGLTLPVAEVLIDGNRVPENLAHGRAIVKGDQTEPAISAASIIAKQARDREMEELAAVYPAYGFAGHKGYPTRVHIAALQAHGVTPHHRRSYAPVQRILKRPE